MLTQLFPKIHRRYTTSSASDWLENFAEWLVSSGYAPRSAQGHVWRLRQVLERTGPFAPETRFSREFLSEIFTGPKIQTHFRATQRAFQRYLEERGQLSAAADPPSRFSAILKAYRQHLSEVKGLVSATVKHHLATVLSFLERALPPGKSLGDLTPRTVEQFVIEEGQRMTRQSLQHPIVRLRSFLRFCHDRGEVKERLDVIDTPRVYREERLPRAIPWPLVQRLLRSIDRSGKSGWRDYAILYLMVHYGLRPSEVAALRLDSIDWASGTLRVDQRKTHTTLILPLNEKTLRMLKRYLADGRTDSSRPEFFLRARTPDGSIKPTAINHIYMKRIRESGLPLLKTSPYCLRHTFAMRLLEQGVGVKAIGDLLGHHSLESTCVYLRLHVEALREVGLPVPGATGERQGRLR